MKSQKSYSTWAEVDLSAIKNNVAQFKDRTKVAVMAIVKANAYGHGMLQTARAAIEGGATWLGVARIEEAQALREGGFKNPILVMGFISGENIESAINEDISITLWSLDQIQMVATSANKVGKKAKIHLKVDTGMSRLGVQPGEAAQLVDKIEEYASITFEGIFTHYARADEEDQAATEDQELKFKKTLESLSEAGLKPPIVHSANSAATINRQSSYFNLVRPGIAIYGLHPSTETQLPGEFRAAMTWKTILSQVKMLPPGRGISYGHDYVTQKEERIGTLPVGYADGFRRVLGNQVLVGGKIVPVVGRVCMDQVCVQLDDVPLAKVGDEVVIIGSQADHTITAEQVAERWGTINYEVVCGVSSRVPRKYL